jgi:hypothetical protein
MRFGGFAIVYFSILVGVSLATPRRWVAIGEEQRFDDWCLTVLGIERHGHRYDVDVRVSNRGRGREQAASDAKLQLITSDFRRIEAIADNSPQQLRSTIAAGDSLDVTCRFEIPDDADVIGVDVVHGAWPQLFIIGDRGSLFYKRPLVRVD